MDLIFLVSYQICIYHICCWGVSSCWLRISYAKMEKTLSSHKRNFSLLRWNNGVNKDLYQHYRNSDSFNLVKVYCYMAVYIHIYDEAFFILLSYLPIYWYNSRFFRLLLRSVLKLGLHMVGIILQYHAFIKIKL